MKAKITKITKKPSKYGGQFYYIFFKGEDGKSYRTMTGTKFGNWQRWGLIAELWGKRAISAIVDAHNGKQNPSMEIWLKGLVIKKDHIIDADSLFEVERR